MAPPNYRSPDEATSPAYRVEPPRASDAIGVALRDAFERELNLPDDMVAMLRRLNGGMDERRH